MASVFGPHLPCPEEIVSNDFMFNIKDECLPLCPLECYRNLYKTAISSYNLLGDTYSEMITNQFISDFSSLKKKTLNLTTIKESIVQVYIYYDSLSYTLSTESPQSDIVSLLASMGGNMGLFLGVSLFNLYEIFGLIIEIAYIKYEKNVQ